MYFVKEALFLFVYNIMMSFLSLTVNLVNIIWLKYVLTVLCLVFYLAVTFVIMKQSGEKAAKQLHANDLNRIQIVKTGKDLPIKRAEEFKTYKGFLIGAISFAPMIFLLLIHLIIHLAGGSSLFVGGISTFCYMVYMGPIFVGINGALTFAQHFIGLYGIVPVAIVSGFGYLFGAKKILLQYEKIAEKQKMIYGE